MRTGKVIVPFALRLLSVLGGFGVASLCATRTHADSFQVSNPLIQQRADPDIYKHTDGYYYFTATIPTYDKIELRRATTIQGLATAAPSVIWTKHTSGIMGAHVWAPELHAINDNWYIYFAAGSTSDTWAIHIYVLENTSANPLQGTWTEKGEVVTSWETMALDATSFEYNGTWYLVWAQNDPSLVKNSSLFIAPMTNPWTLKSPGVRISTPEYAWEKVGAVVEEGPAVLIRNGRVFIAFSASATDANYCIGLLTASVTSNLLSVSSWSKSPTPVFKSGNGVYGPGHNQFTTSPDGSIDLLVYHGRDYATIPAQYGSSLNDPNRHTRVQRLNWNSDGTPNFGSPLANGLATIGTGGATGTGGASGMGGANTTGGASPSGGAPASGGRIGTGGATAGAGAAATGGRTATGGASAIGGAWATGGKATTGGAAGGSLGTDGTLASTGGVQTTGGIQGVGGGTGGAVSATGVASIGGVSAVGSSISIAGGAGTGSGGDSTGDTASVGGTSLAVGAAGLTESTGNCSCRVPGTTSIRSGTETRLVLLGLAALWLRRRRQSIA